MFDFEDESLSGYSDSKKKAIWAKGIVVDGVDEDKWRKDASGAWMGYDYYGDYNSQYCWEVDHILPKAKGGTNDIRNLRPLQWENNREKDDNFPAFKSRIIADGTKNIQFIQSWKLGKNTIKWLKELYPNNPFLSNL